uniref:Trefoil factor 3 n=1 Tax=Rhinolophus ferrumequinum TaxID=59479 RepID=A0A671E047_RHIFE
MLCVDAITKQKGRQMTRIPSRTILKLFTDWALSGTAENQCAVPAKDRVDCGYPQVTAEQCNSRGCCFDSSIPGVPWCFKPLEKSECTF